MKSNTVDFSCFGLPIYLPFWKSHVGKIKSTHCLLERQQHITWFSTIISVKCLLIVDVVCGMSQTKSSTFTDFELVALWAWRFIFLNLVQSLFKLMLPVRCAVLVLQMWLQNMSWKEDDAVRGDWVVCATISQQEVESIPIMAILSGLCMCSPCLCGLSLGT